MIATIPSRLALPRPPLAPSGSIGMGPQMRGYLDDSIARFDRDLIRALENELRRLIGIVNMLVDIVNGSLWQADLVGAKDGTNVTFDWPAGFTPGTDPDGRPQVQLYWKTGLQLYTATNPPGLLEWTIVDGRVVLGQAPLAGDSLVIYAFPDPEAA